jgi:DNA-binding transcriptional ArsR family regulator
MLTETLALHNQGFNLLPLKAKSKEPLDNLSWRRFNYYKQTIDDVENLFNGHEGNRAVICGETSGNLVVLDCDTDDAFMYAWDRLRKFNPKIVRSPRGGHIYIRTSVPAKNKIVKSEHGKIEVRSTGLYVVAEGSLHPNGMPYFCLNNPEQLPVFNLGPLPDLPFIVLEPDNHETGAFQVLAESGLLDRLHNGQYASRSEADMALITFLTRKGYGKEGIGKIINRIGYPSRYMELLATNPGRASAWLEISIKKATGLENTEEFNNVQQTIREIKSKLVSTPLEGKSGASLYKTLLAHLGTCEISGKWQYHLSVREASEKSGISHITFMKRNNELIDAGLVAAVERHRGIEGNVYELNVEALKQFLESKSVQDFTIQSHPTVTNCESYGPFGMFEHGSIGHSANQIYNTIASSAGVTVTELVSMTGRSRNTIKRALIKMVDCGLIIRNGKVYLVSDKQVATVALEENYIHKAVKRRYKHIKERMEYRSYNGCVSSQSVL